MQYVNLFVLLVIVGVAAGYAWIKRENMRKFYDEVKFEMHKVTWPPVEEVINSTILVFVVTIALAIVCLAADSVFSAVLKFVYGT
jgi:preprotein translocase SecE subunit